MEDLILLLEVSSLKTHKSGKGETVAAWPDNCKCSHDSPNLSDQIVDGVPSDRPVSDRSPPTHQVCGFDVGVGMEVVRNWYFRISERRSDETDAVLCRVCG